MAYLVRLALISGAAAIFAGCGGSQPQPTEVEAARASGTVARLDRKAFPVPFNPSRSSGRYKTTQPLLFVTNVTAAYNDVRIYRARAKDPAPLATISDGINTPSGACVDGEGTLYVVNEPSSGPGWISEYPLGKTSPAKMITDGISSPVFCAIDAKGNLWVTNLGGPNATEYLYRSKKPHTVITIGLTFPVGIAIDHSGDLYVANGWDASQQNVEVYPPGAKSPSRTITDGVTWPVGIAVDSMGTLYVTNAAQDNVAEYRSGQDYPFQTITEGMNTPVGVTVNKKNVLYVANLGANNVVEFPPGSLTLSKRKISKGLYNPQGLALFPPLRP